MLKIHKHPSPNFGNRPPNTKIDTIIIHFTEMKDDTSALNRLCDPQAQVSSHYLINKKGEVYSLVSDSLRAWHAGVSHWKGRDSVNDFSIGIELDNNGNEEFSKDLMNSLIKLCKKLINEHPINPLYILGHSDIAPGRKVDPGRYFDWKLLAKNGIGPDLSNIKKDLYIKDTITIQKMLIEYGYKLEATGVMDQDTLDVMKSFNDHFNPECLEAWNELSQSILSYLIHLE